jgi:hypothetical protein
VYLLIQACFIALIVVPVIFKVALKWAPKGAPFNGSI